MNEVVKVYPNEVVKVYLDLLKTQLTSHGVMLFAVLSASILYLDVVRNYASSLELLMRNPSLVTKIVSIGGLILLYGLSIYVLIRLIAYSMMISTLMYFKPNELKNDSNFPDLASEIHVRLLKEYRRNPVLLQIYWINYRMLWRLLVSSILGLFLACFTIWAFAPSVLPSIIKWVILLILLT